MIDCVELMEKKVLRKIMNRKKGVKRARAGRKEELVPGYFSWIARDSVGAYV